jgi:diacylglycerol kinase (ATP)
MNESNTFPKDAKEMRSLLIIKPSQIFFKGHFEAEARKFFKRCDVICPDNLDHLAKVVELASKSYDLLLVGGGDGTLNRVIQNLNREEIGIGVIALGSGNDFARNFKKAGATSSRFGVFESASWLKVDLIRVNEHVFHNSGGIGLDAETLDTRENSHGKFLRHYGIAFLRTLPRLKKLKCRIELDKERFDGDYLWALVINNPWIGGGMLAAPKATFIDGLFDILLVKNTPKLKLAALFPLIYSGRHITNPLVVYRQSKSLNIETEVPITKLALDGELYTISENNLKFEIMERALWVFGTLTTDNSN